jgi:hypothetical protein
MTEETLYCNFYLLGQRLSCVKIRYSFGYSVDTPDGQLTVSALSGRGDLNARPLVPEFSGLF